jgi:hypothetical protein
MQLKMVSIQKKFRYHLWDIRAGLWRLRHCESAGRMKQSLGIDRFVVSLPRDDGPDNLMLD